MNTESLYAIDALTQHYLQSTLPWFTAIFERGRQLFVTLAVISVAWNAFTLALNKTDLTDVLFGVTRQILFLGFFYSCVCNAGTWTPWLLNFFLQIGQTASDIETLDPSGVLLQGYSIVASILEASVHYGFFKNPVGSMLGVFTCFTVALCYIFITTELIFTLIKSYVLVALSPLFFAFGATKWTLPIVQNFLSKTIEISLKLMMLFFVVSIGQSLGAQWCTLAKLAGQNKQIMPYFTVAAGAIIYFFLAKNVPSFIAEIAQGAIAIGPTPDRGTAGTSSSLTSTMASGAAVAPPALYVASQFPTGNPLPSPSKTPPSSPPSISNQIQ